VTPPKAVNKPYDNLSILNPGNEQKRAPLGPYPNPGVEIKLNPLPGSQINQPDAHSQLPNMPKPEIYPVSYEPLHDYSKLTKPNQPDFSRVGGRWKKKE